MSFDKAAFHQLRSDRLAYVEGLRRNKGFEAGILKLLTQLYPDNAHFIYELLQNAEDAKATHARFTLSENSLVFEHDGTRLFSARDVESITSIGDSTKADSPTEIGKFGVGFKSVFAYTQNPEIHSGEYHFRIHDLVVPELLPPPSSYASSFKTKFIFPFDNPKKPSRQANHEIAVALQALDDATLLFLANIDQISYLLPDGFEGRLERLLPLDIHQATGRGQQINVVIHTPTRETRKSSWLKYSQVVTIDDESTRKDCAIALAFGMEEVEGRTKKSHWRVVPLHPGRVCIYFPAEKETSNLRFHVHAPFASTVARDSVRDCDGNHQLLAALGDLAAASLIDIRDRGLMTLGALEVLPIEDDNLPRFYEPIKEKIVNAFTCNDLVPTRAGGHRASVELFRGPADIAAQFNDEDLAEISGKKWIPPLWCANPPQTNQRADKFLDSLSIINWGWEELSESLDCTSWRLIYGNDKERPDRLKSWLSKKDDVWLRKFYALLYDAVFRYHRHFDVSELCLIRAQKDSNEQMVRPRDAFFPQNDSDQGKLDVMWVKAEVYSTGKSEIQKNNAKIFLDHVGVKTFDEKADLSRILETYSENSFPDDATHIRHFMRFIKFYKKHPENIDIFSGKSFILGTRISDPDKKAFHAPAMFCLDAPYEETGLALLEINHRKYLLWDGYSAIDLKADFVKFIKAAGVQAELQIVKVSPENNQNWEQLSIDYHYPVRKTDTAISIDWTINQIKRLLAKPSLEASRLIWRALIRSDGEVAKARFRPNRQYGTRESDSQLICHLKGSAWIPDCDGNFLPPQEMSRTRLRSDFPYDNQNRLLDAIGFEDSVQRETEEYQRKDLAAREFGFTGVDAATEVANAAKQAGLDASEIVALIKQHAPRPEQPEDEVRNPVRRRAGVLEHRENAPTREAVRREQLIQPNVSSVIAEAKAYLRAKYTNANRQMVCQACHCEMPFKLGTGEYYFEAVQVFRDLKKHYFENRLALCPTCAAMYQHARSIDDKEFKQLFSENASVNSVVELPIELAGEHRTLRFVGTHFFDLTVIIGTYKESS